MNQIPPFTFQDPHPSHFEDQMELGTSPYLQHDELDIDLDPMRDTSVEPFHDKMTDNVDDRYGYDEEIIYDEHEAEKNFNDDEMLDELGDQGVNGDENIDHQMASNEIEPDIGDEDIIYDEDHEITEFYQDEIQGDHSDISPGNNGVDASEQTIIDETLGQHETVEEVDPEDGNGLATNLDNSEQISTALFDHLEPPSYHEDASRGAEPSESVQQNASLFTILEEQEQEQIYPERDDNDIDNTTEFSGQNLNSEMHRTVVGEDITGKQGSNTEDASAVRIDPQPTVDSQKVYSGSDDISADEIQHQSSERRASSSAPPNLHPVIVVYLGEEMSLFPPSRNDQSTTYFLADATLAFESLDKLLVACREILAGSIGHDDELVLDINSLGLHICEDSKHALQLSLGQIVEAYLALSHNGQAEDVGPLFCTLSSRVCLASQYAYLLEAAQEGKTFSEVAAEYVDSPEADSGLPEYEIDEVGKPSGAASVDALTGSNTVDGNVIDDDTAIPSTTENAHLSGSAVPSDPEDKTKPQSEPLAHLIHDDEDVDDKKQREDLQQISSDVRDDGNENPLLMEDPKTNGTLHDNANTTVNENSDGAVFQEKDAAESDGSRTVQGDPDVPAENDISAGYEDLFRNEDFNDDKAHHEDVYEEEEEEEEEETIDDDNGFTDQNGYDAGKLTHGAEEKADNVPAVDPDTTHHTAGHIKSYNQASVTSNSNEAIVATAESVAGDLISTSMPKTPSKANSTKRRIEEDDDYGLIDTSTPEPKRSRSVR